MTLAEALAEAATVIAFVAVTRANAFATAVWARLCGAWAWLAALALRVRAVMA